MTSVDSTSILEKEYIKTLPPLFSGAKGTYVKILQVLLEYYGPIKVNVTGEFDAVTDAAVRSIQNMQGMKVTGICGYDMWEYLLVKAKDKVKK